MGAAILGLGSAFPARRLGQAEAARFAAGLSCAHPGQLRVLQRIFEKSGVESRGSVLLERDAGVERMAGFFAANPDAPNGPSTAVRMRRFAEEALPLAREAAGKALADAGCGAGAITHLITVSCTGFFAPGLDIGLIQSLGLSADVARTNIGFMGCHGALNGMQVGRAFAEADEGARVLLCAAELCSLHFQYGWNADNVVANALFADGAAAAVMGAAEKSEGLWKVAATGSHLVAESTEAMSWRIGDHGFAMTLSARVPELIVAQLPGWLEGWLGARGLAVDEIGSWGVHPGGPRILSAVEEALRLPEGALSVSRAVLAEHGNMSSPTILAILERMRAAAKPTVLLAFGPGLIVEAVLLK